MKIKRLIRGTYESNGYIVWDNSEAIIIDPGYTGEDYLEFIKKEKLNLTGIYLTHHHHDHVGGVAKIREELKCPVYIHRLDGDMYRDEAIYLEDGEYFSVGKEDFKVINTPGHTWGSCCFLNRRQNIAFTGDTIFNVDLGRTDLEDGSEEDIVKSIRDKISLWNNGMFIYPGHGDGCTMKKVRQINQEYIGIMNNLVEPKIKLVALDLDGTTLNQESVLSQRNKEVLKKALTKGVHVVVATGRCFSAIPDELKTFDGIEYMVTSNGGLTKEVLTDKIIGKSCISKESIEGIINNIDGESKMAEVFINGDAYIEEKHYNNIVNGGITYRHRQYVLNTRKPIKDLRKLILENSEDIENINIFYDTLEERAIAKKELDKIPNITVTTSLGTNWEIGGKNTSKASALKVLMKDLGIKKEELMACGDNSNDCEMIKLAGKKVAVENGNEEVKKVAQYIVSSNEFDGVAEAIERFVLG